MLHFCDQLPRDYTLRVAWSKYRIIIFVALWLHILRCISHNKCLLIIKIYFDNVIISSGRWAKFINTPYIFDGFVVRIIAWKVVTMNDLQNDFISLERAMYITAFVPAVANARNCKKFNISKLFTYCTTSIISSCFIGFSAIYVEDR